MKKRRMYGARAAARMTEEEITRVVFRGAGPRQYRGLSDAFTLPGIQAIAGSEHAKTWRAIACDMLGRGRT